MSNLKLDVGLASDLKSAFRRTGWSEEDIKKATEGDFLGHVLLALRGEADIVTREREHYIDCESDPYVPEGWSIEEHRPHCGFRWNPARVTLYLSAEQKRKKSIEGHELRKELAEEPVLNANVLDYLLERTHLIPKEWKRTPVFFWGTIYRNPDSNLRVRFLYWEHNEYWEWGAVSLGHEWHDDGPAAILVR